MHKTSRITLVLVIVVLLSYIYVLRAVSMTHRRLHQKKEQLQAEQQKAEEQKKEQQKAEPSGTNRGSQRP